MAKDWSALYNRAHEAGMEAGQAHTPEPMVVMDAHTGYTYPPVMDGVCGFAWVNVKPGTSSFARWIRSNGHGRTDSYYGGTTVWVRFFNQSYEKKLAYAEAFAEVLREAGIKAYASGRLD